MNKTKVIFASLALAVSVAAVALTAWANKPMDPFFEANLEALMSNEDDSLLRLGHHYEICGALLIDATGRPYNCTKLTIVCDFINKNDCDLKECEH